MTLSPDNFFKIEGWMRTDLNLKGNELMAYALIYSFQTAYNKPFDGSQAYIAEWLGISRTSTNKMLLRLQEKELVKIDKIDKGYLHKNSYSCQKMPQIILDNSVKKVNTRMLRKLTLDSEESSQRSVKKVNNKETDIGNTLLNKSMKEREESQQVAPSPSPEITWDEIIAENAKAKEKQKPKSKRFAKPTIKEIEAYCKEKDFTIDVEYLYNYYESNGWMVGRVHMKDWKRAVQNWAKREKNYNSRGRPLTMKEKLEDERLRRNQIVGEELYKNEYYDDAWE